MRKRQKEVKYMSYYTAYMYDKECVNYDGKIRPKIEKPNWMK